MTSQALDFDLHRKAAIDEYSVVRERYEGFCRAAESILRSALTHVAVHQITSRAKSVESFGKKAARPAPDDPKLPKYRTPMEQIRDKAGVRVVTFVLRDIAKVEAVVRQQFDELERIDKFDAHVEKGSVGYRSIHYIVRLRDDRTSLPEYSEFAGLAAEIQIRTILQHAWAEMEHDIRYKATYEDLPLFQR
ncbi:MAG TPA: RelA/SpoT domain-containing protein, partial [Gemmatimonadaceae bacterium]